MSKDNDKNNWFRGININPFNFKRNSYLPFFDESADYNTNSKSYYDYLARINRILEVMKHFIIRLLDRDVKTKDTPTVSLKKEGDWIDNGKGNYPNNYDDDITLSANVKRSVGKETLILNDNSYEVGNALTEKDDGLFSPDYKALMEEFEAGGGGTELDYSGQTETRTYTNIQPTPFNITNGSKNKGGTEIHELWSPEYDNVLRAVDFRLGEINDLLDGLEEKVENPPEIDFGYVHDTFLPKTTFYYSYYDATGELLSGFSQPLYTFKLPQTPVNLSEGNRDIIISFTPVVINPDKYEIEEVIFWGAGDLYTRIDYFRDGRSTPDTIYSSIGVGENLVSGRRYHIRLSQNNSNDNFQFNVTFRHVIHAVLKNKVTGASFKPWELDGDKPIPQTEEEMQNMEFYMKDVEIRVVNQ